MGRHMKTDEIKIVELKESILADNQADAEVLRQELKRKKTCLLMWVAMILTVWSGMDYLIKGSSIITG